VHRFGGTVGGPVFIPKVYDGRNRTFFFALYEGQRILAASLAQHTLPTDIERRGNFTQSLIASGQMKVIYDPSTTRANPAQAGRFIRDPFPGNVIPTDRLDPVALKAQRYYPAPNGPGLPFSKQNNFIAQAAARGQHRRSHARTYAHPPRPAYLFQPNGRYSGRLAVGSSVIESLLPCSPDSDPVMPCVGVPSAGYIPSTVRFTRSDLASL